MTIYKVPYHGKSHNEGAWQLSNMFQPSVLVRFDASFVN